jgi:hypothetical protein
MLSKKISFIALSALLSATAAFGASAPDDMKLMKVRPGAKLLGLPTVEIKVDPSLPRPPTFDFHFKGGQILAAGLALDGTVKGASDPRMTEGNITCSAIMERSSIPAIADLQDGRPATASKTVSFASGTVVTMQQVQIPFEIYDQFNTVSHNNLICYKVSKAPFTVRDLKAALGPKFAIDLSTEQSADISASSKVLAALSTANSPMAPKIEGDSGSPKSVPAPGDAITGEATTGNFVVHTPAK